MNNMDLEFLRWFLGLVVAGFCGVLWWNFRGMATDLKEQKAEFAKHQLYVANHCAKHSDLEKTASSFERVVERIESKLDQLFARIDSKADKP